MGLGLEEFGIYLNYVRKLGFEEAPDYDFLRELFAKVMKNNGDVDDQVYDWNLLNGELLSRSSLLLVSLTASVGGKGWESVLAQNQILAQIQNQPAADGRDRRRDGTRDDKKRASQAGDRAGVAPPSPAVVRSGSRQQTRPGGLAPPGAENSGQVTPLSAQAHVNVPIGTPVRRMSQQLSHPYANAGYDYQGQNNQDEYSASQQPYGRASPMVSSVGAAPPAVSNVRAAGGEQGASHGDGYHGQSGEERPKNTFWQIITCRCG